MELKNDQVGRPSRHRPAHGSVLVPGSLLPLAAQLSTYAAQFPPRTVLVVIPTRDDRCGVVLGLAAVHLHAAGVPVELLSVDALPSVGSVQGRLPL